MRKFESEDLIEPLEIASGSFDNPVMRSDL